MSPLLMMAASAMQKAQQDAYARKQQAIQMQMHGPGTENMPQYGAQAAQLVAQQRDTPIDYGSAFKSFGQQPTSAPAATTAAAAPSALGSALTRPAPTAQPASVPGVSDVLTRPTGPFAAGGDRFLTQPTGPFGASDEEMRQRAAAGW